MGSEGVSAQQPVSSVSPVPQGAPQAQQPQQGARYQSVPPLLQIIDYVLSSPSIPSEMRVQFYSLWELPILGNFDKLDIARLMLSFKRWCNHLLMYIPDRNWGNTIVYRDKAGCQVLISKDSAGKVTGTTEVGGTELQMNTLMLLDTLDQAYYINLTRGKEGFTLKELATIRQAFRTEDVKAQENKGFRLF